MSWLDQVLVEQLGLSLLHFLWQGALIGLLYAATLPATRHATASTRYGIAVLTLAALAAAPLLTLGVLLRASAQDVSPAMLGDVMEPARLALQVGADSGPGGAAVMQWVVIAWLAGVVLLSARLLLGWHFLRRLRRSADFAAAAALRPTLQALASHLGITRQVGLAVSAGIRSPVVIGWLRPLVLLPPAIVAGLPTRQLEMVLAHELAHVRRLDHLVNLCQTVIETVLYYHPVVRWVSRRIRFERENACDDLAVAATDDRLAYVEMLASLEKLRFRGPRLALAVHDGQILSRIRRLVERGGPDRQLGLTGPFLLAGLVVLATAGLQLVEDEASVPSTQTTAESVPAVQAATPVPLVRNDEPATTTPADPAQVVSERADRDRGSQGSAITEQPPALTGAAPAPTSQAAARPPASDDTPERSAVESEPPGLPRMETDRLPPASEMLEFPEGRELAMVERPALIAPRLPEPPSRRTLPVAEPTLSGGKLIERVEPDYPRSARQRGLNGSVKVAFLVTPDGGVREIKVIDESPRGLDFAESAREAIERWRFEPFRQEGEPVERHVQMEISFDLGDEKQHECRSVLGSRIPRCYD